MDVIVTLSYAPVHGPDEFLKAIEAEATLGRKDRSFQEVQIMQSKNKTLHFSGKIGDDFLDTTRNRHSL